MGVKHMGTPLLKQSEKRSAHAVFDYLDNRGIPINSGSEFIACVEIDKNGKPLIKMNFKVTILPYNILGDFGLDIHALKYTCVGEFELSKGFNETFYEHGNLYINNNGYTIIIYNKELPELPYLNCDYNIRKQ